MFWLDARTDLCWMNLRFPKALVRVNVSHPAQHLLVEQQHFDARTSRTDSRHKFVEFHFERIRSEPQQLPFECRAHKKRESPETPRVHIAQFPSVIEQSHQMRV